MQTLIAQDATLNNSLTLIEPRWQRSSQGRMLQLGFGVEKMVSPRLDVEIGGQWESVSPRSGPSATAFGDVDLALKYVFLERPDFRVVLAPQLSFPTAANISDEPAEVRAGGFISFGARLGRVAEDRLPGYLRAIELQGDLGYYHGFGGRGSNEIFFDPVLDYSMPYLGYSTGVRNRWPLNNLCVFTELNFDQLLSGNGDGSLSLFATPGIAYLDRNYQVTVGVKLPLTRGAEKTAQVAVAGSIIIFLDQLIPSFAWTPF